MESHPFAHWLCKAEEIDFPIETSLQHSFLNNLVDSDGANHWKSQGCYFRTILSFFNLVISNSQAAFSPLEREESVLSIIAVPSQSFIFLYT